MAIDKQLNRVIAGLVFLFSLVVYYMTVAPTTSFWDCGEFITCSYILGVPHPPGAPIYLLLGRVFSMIPWAADIGLRVNIISSIATALTIMFTYLIIVQLIKMWRGAPQNIADCIILYGSGIIGSLALAFSDSIWFNGVEAEVYAISTFFTAIVVWLILVWNEHADDPTSDRYLLLIAYCIGIAIGIHLLNILALPAVFLIIYFRKFKLELKTFSFFAIFTTLIFIAIYPGIVKVLPNMALHLSAWFFLFVVIALFAGCYYAIRNNRRVSTLLLTSFLLIILGTSTYSMIYIRSNLNPAIDENDPETMENLVSYLNREQYGDWSYIERRAPLWEYQIKKMYIRYLGWQFIGTGDTIGPDGFIAETISFKGLWGVGFPFIIGLFGILHHFFKDWKRAFSMMILFLMTGLAIVLYLNQPDPQPRERDYVYVGSYFAFALWIGIGMAGVLEAILDTFKSRSTHIQIAALGAISLLAFIFIPINLLANNFHSHDRSGNYVAFDYSYNILQSCEENALLFTNGDNDTFPLWFLQEVYGIRKDVRVINLSLLNTHWYIKQLKTRDFPVPINLTDAQIDKLSLQLWPQKRTMIMDVPPNVYKQDIADLGEQKSLIFPKDAAPKITFDVEPTVYGKAIRVQDWMVLNIIASNQFKYPVYFAVTVSPENMLNMDDYLRMDGLTLKLVTYPGEQIAPAKLRKNIFDSFQYRNLNNPHVYYNTNIMGLLSNYRAAFMRLASFYHNEKMYDDMITVLDKMEEVIPESVIPMFDIRASFSVGRMYMDGGKPEEFSKRLDYYLNQNDVSVDEKFDLGRIYYDYLKDANRAEQVVREIIDERPNYFRGYYWLFTLYDQTKQYQKGIELANELLAVNANDMQAKVRLERFQKLQNSDSTSIEN
ncbi:DUF2723 domain-containing protein [candidate division KSB1 bacterium]|nr:DUF2723 domain-containing protein [candidate division KSB1 bacterium]